MNGETLQSRIFANRVEYEKIETGVFGLDYTIRNSRLGNC